MVGSGGGAGQLPVSGRPTTLEYCRQGLLCLQQVRDGWAVFFVVFFFCCFFFLFFFFFFFCVCVCVCVCLLLLFFVISSILSSFSNASSAGRQLDILKYCGLGRYNPAVVSVTTSLSTD